MRGQSAEFLASLRRKHGLGEFGGRRSRPQRAKKVKARKKSSIFGKPRAFPTKKRRVPSGRLGLGL